MGKPKNVEPAKVDENYNWGEFGYADKNGAILSGQAADSVSDAQGGINRYLNELINPSYDNESFKARMDLLDASNRQYANELGANAIARGARGSATQNILNSIMANRNNNMRSAMTEEDARIRSILSSLSGIESNYFNHSNTMANNILQRVLCNQTAQNDANKVNTQAQNAWANNLWSGGANILGSIAGGLLSGYMMGGGAGGDGGAGY